MASHSDYKKFISNLKNIVESNSFESYSLDNLWVHKVESIVPQEKFNQLASHLTNYSVYLDSSNNKVNSEVFQVSLDDEEISIIRERLENKKQVDNPELVDTLSSMVNLINGFFSVNWKPKKREINEKPIIEGKLLKFSRSYGEKDFWLKVYLI